MIFVFQDETKIPAKWLDKVGKLQAKLDALQTVEERKKFIDDHGAVWGEVKRQLLKMSHGKCWYSEALDAVSDWHVDHFRPKKCAVDADGTEHDGYYWLAFDWKNYRISGSFPNAPHKDDDGVTRGKWDYFPLANGSPRADWDHRDTRTEVCLLLDPINPADPKLMTFDEKGMPVSSDPTNAFIRKRVATTTHYLYLDSPRLIAARKQKWREVLDWIDEYHDACPEDENAVSAQDAQRLSRHIRRLADLTSPASPYAGTARACLRANGLSAFIQSPEEAQAA